MKRFKGKDATSTRESKGEGDLSLLYVKGADAVRGRELKEACENAVVPVMFERVDEKDRETGLCPEFVTNVVTVEARRSLSSDSGSTM